MPLPTISRQFRSPLHIGDAAVIPSALRTTLFVPTIVVLLLIFAAELFLSARQESQTFDEPAHLSSVAGGLSLWADRCDDTEP